MRQEIYENYINILKEQLVPALGCTEPIAIAYAGAKVREVLGEFPQKVAVKCSGNMIKNVKGVTVPNSGDLKGIDTAALLGIIGGRADMELEVLESVTDEDRAYLRELLKKDICTCDLVPDTDNLYIDITVWSENHSAQVIISTYHTNIVKIVKDDTVILDKENQINHQENTPPADKALLNVKDIIEFADTVKIEDIKPILAASKKNMIESFMKVRGRKKALLTLVKIIQDNIINPEEQTIYIAHCDCLDEAKKLGEQIKAAVKCKDVYIEYYDFCTGAHVGPDTIAVFYEGKERAI